MIITALVAVSVASTGGAVAFADTTVSVARQQLVPPAEEDWAYVAELAAHDPGPQVRAAASRALSRHTDVALDQFFQIFWPFAADLDEDAFRRPIEDRDHSAHYSAGLWTDSAEAEEKDERESTSGLAEAHRSRAIDAWRQVEAVAGKANVDWAADQAEASRRADAWTAVADHARTATTGRDWAAVVALGESHHTSWAETSASAQANSDSWKATADHARASIAADEARGGGNH
jgi:hypothetical protein